MNITHKEEGENEKNEEFCKNKYRRTSFGIERSPMGFYPTTNTIDWEEPEK
jgi:hypothetical protein